MLCIFYFIFYKRKVNSSQWKHKLSNTYMSQFIFIPFNVTKIWTKLYPDPFFLLNRYACAFFLSTVSQYNFWIHIFFVFCASMCSLSLLFYFIRHVFIFFVFLFFVFRRPHNFSLLISCELRGSQVMSSLVKNSDFERVYSVDCSVCWRCVPICQGMVTLTCRIRSFPPLFWISFYIMCVRIYAKKHVRRSRCVWK